MDEKACKKGTENLLQALGSSGYRASAKKAQICKSQVMYLGYTLKGGQSWLSEACKETVLKIPTPKNVRQVREFLGTAGFYCLWIVKGWWHTTDGKKILPKSMGLKMLQKEDLASIWVSK